ncbi:Zinc finger protein [Pseudolycoriella hygida]|uniref:Zinc finger protein n=1 Tax=Pseudolycoriella hygida TaxID=35572 RepID=A0A9Q0S4U1_9DIPT|nr:Zinc finger protein [Pseudolycoriella hygida]
MKFEIFARTIENKDHTDVCRFCLAENTSCRIKTRTIANLFKELTSEDLSLSLDYPDFVCGKCESKLQTAIKIRNDIEEIEKCWKQYINEMHVVRDVKVEDLDEEYDKFETVEILIEPVHQEDLDYLNSSSSTLKYENQYESYVCEDYISDGMDDVLETSNPTIETHDDADNPLEAIEKMDCKESDASPKECDVLKKKSRPETTETTQLSCDICKKTYSSRHGIRAHMERHAQGSTDLASRSKLIMRYKCHSCNERFDKKKLLEEHEMRHSGNVLHVCHICGIGKKSKSLINNHLRTHTENYIPKRTRTSRPRNTKRYYTCWLCPTRLDFNTVDELKLHRKEYHHDFECPFCKNGFMTNQALQSHMLIHSTHDRPHKCAICGGSFSKIGHLKSHIQGKHAERKPYPCDKCDKGFVHRYQLQSHIRIFHEKIKAFKCSQCTLSFGHSKSRVWHMRTVHKM